MTWASVALGDICEFKYGKSLVAAHRAPGNVPVYGSNGVVGSHTSALTNGPTIVIGRKGSFGEVNYSPTACWPIDTTYYIDASATSADLKWLAHLLPALGLTELNRAAAVPGLNREDAYSRALLLPPIEEQRRIAAILDQADALRSMRRETLSNLGRLASDLFVGMFGDPRHWASQWPMGTIGDMAASTQYGTSARADSVGSLAVLRMGNITVNGRLDLTDLKFMDLKPSEFERYTVRRGDILFNRTNSADLVGKTAVVHASGPFAYAGYLVRLRVAEGYVPEYIAGYLNSRHGKVMLRSMAKAIVGQANINAQELRSIKIAMPPFKLQKAYASAVAEIARQSQRAGAQLAELDALFASLQARAFSGLL